VIERVFDHPKCSPAEDDTVINAKKRKPNSPLHPRKQLPGGTFNNSWEDDFDEPYYIARKRFSGNGVGYAGSMHEDVSRQYMWCDFDSRLAVRSIGCGKGSERPGQTSSQIAITGPSLPAGCEQAWWSQDFRCSGSPDGVGSLASKKRFYP
jgi:hypothetical protein